MEFPNPYDYFSVQLSSPSWHWEIVWYLFLAGIAAGTYITSAMTQLVGSKADAEASLRGYLVGLPLITLSGILITLDIDKPLRFLNLFWYWREMTPMIKVTTPMNLGAWGFTVFGFFATVGFLYAFVKKGKVKHPLLVKVANWFHEGPVFKAYLIVGILVAFFLATYTGVLVNTTHIPSWAASPWLPVLFLASGMSTAIALMVLLTPKKQDGYLHKLERADIMMMILELVVIVALVVSLGAWASKITSGTMGILLWGGVVGVGLVFPLLLKWKPNLLGARTAIISSIMVIVGGYLLRYVMVMGPQAGVYGF